MSNISCNGTYNCSCQPSWLCCILLSVIFMIHYINALIKNDVKDYTQLLASSADSKNITINILDIENLQIQIPKNKIFYEVKNNAKFFTENKHSPHLDKLYGTDELSKEEIHKTLRYLFLEFKTNFLVNLSKSHNITDISYWLEYGTLLGSYREKDIIQWDDDGDIGIFLHDLNRLPIKYETTDWIFRRNPNINNLFYDSRNTVRARLISKINGVFIDFYPYSVVYNVENNKRYMYNSWSLNNFDFWQVLDDLLPINESGIFLKNHTFNVPHNTKKWLLNEYKTLEPPIDMLWIYDDNYTYDGNYWFNSYDDYESSDPVPF